MLGSLEAKVLGVLEEERRANVRDVVDKLNDGDEDLAYTTVGTILNRLHEKGLVERKEEPYKGGSRYVYEYVDFQDEYIDEVLRDVVALFGDEGIEELRQKVEETDTTRTHKNKDDKDRANVEEKSTRG
ncbi:MAG: BlaI/MecI/CopY family transcriptional regulator [Halobacteriales archaeon]|nr:BlaI/MecI/CopY family transcriptional regulator [Halobacteriales archaeon]